MEYGLSGFSRLSEADIRQLATLHHTVMRTLLTELGLPVIWRYYQIAHADPAVVGVCARSASGEILGWAVGSPHPEDINARLRTPLTWFLLQILRLTLTHPMALWHLAATVLSGQGASSVREGAVELTYIGVATSQRGKGIGRSLLSAFVEASRARGFRSIVLSVERQNVSAISLYRQAGFTTTRTYSEGRYLRHRMELALG